MIADMAKFMDAIEVVSNTVSVPASTSSQIITVSSPTGKKVLGGGANSDGYVFTRYSYPAADGSAWKVEVGNNDAIAHDVIVYAVCVG